MLATDLHRGTIISNRCEVFLSFFLQSPWTAYSPILSLQSPWFLSLYSSVLICAQRPQSQSQSYVTTDGQSASLSWNKAPIWGLRPDFHYCRTIACLLIWGALSDERTGLFYNVQYTTAPSAFPCVINLRHGSHTKHLLLPELL
jgi:hypothetical protein